MKVIDGILYASECKLLRRKSNLDIVGASYALGKRYYSLTGEILDNPVEETESDFEEVTKEDIFNEHASEYSGLVESYVRERYSVSAELALQRQRDTKPEQFKEYFDYCEECKARAKRELGL